MRLLLSLDPSEVHGRLNGRFKCKLLRSALSKLRLPLKNWITSLRVDTGKTPQPSWPGFMRISAHSFSLPAGTMRDCPGFAR